MKEKLVKYRTKGNTSTVKAEKHNPALKLRWQTQEDRSSELYHRTKVEDFQ